MGEADESKKKGNLWVLLKLFLCYCFELENRGCGAYAVWPNDIWLLLW